MLTREAIVQSEKTFKVRRVSTPEWALSENGATDAHVFVRTLAADQAGAVQALAVEHKDADSHDKEARAMAGWCVLGVCDADGLPLFTDTDIPALLVRPLMPLQRCASAIMELNGVTEEAEGAEKKG